MATYCQKCYAQVESPTNHQNWHARLERELRDLRDLAERAKRDARRGMSSH
jgi:hypothetical protein